MTGVSVLLLLAIPAWAVSFDEVRSNLDTQDNTRAYVRQYWKDNKGKEVSWSGTVVEVKGGRGDNYTVYVLVSDSALDSNVILYVKGQPAAARLKKGQKVSFTGALLKYSWGGGQQLKQLFKDEEWARDIVITLDNVRLK